MIEGYVTNTSHGSMLETYGYKRINSDPKIKAYHSKSQDRVIVFREENYLCPALHMATTMPRGIKVLSFNDYMELRFNKAKEFETIEKAIKES